LSVFHDLGRNLSHVAAFENTLFDIGSNRGSQVKIDVEVKSITLAHARGGEVVLYKRGDSKKWQARFKLKDLKWRRVATKHENLQYAAQTACEAYDRARFLFDANVPISSKRFDVVAKLAIEEMEAQIASGNGKSVYNDYITATKRYLIPYFGNYHLNSIGYDELKKFGTWRVKTMGRSPVLSTVTTHNSAMNRVFNLAVERGWIAQAQVPKLKNNGKKGTAREAFSLSDYKSLVGFMPHWVDKAHTEKSKQMRRLLRDYVLVLSNTGIRHGTEAMGLRWRDIEWIVKDGERYLQLTVNGKVGKRTAIARHNTETYLTRLQERSSNIAKMSFDALLKKQLNQKVFVLEDGTETYSLAGTFRTLMRESGLDNNRDTKEKRTLYSLRHTYAHLCILQERMDVYTLSTQMGTSVKMIEQHYGHLQPAQKADVIAGRRMNTARSKVTGAQQTSKPKLKVVK
jgi:integrase